MTYYVFGQDPREAGALTNLNSMPESWLMGEGSADKVMPIILDDPEKRGDIGPAGGENNCGDIIGGACLLFSSRLMSAMRAFGLVLDSRPTLVRTPDGQSIEGYEMVTGLPRRECLIGEELLSFRVDAGKIEGDSLFYMTKGFSSLLVIDEMLRVHLGLESLTGVFMVGTEDYDRDFAFQLI